MDVNEENNLDDMGCIKMQWKVCVNCFCFDFQKYIYPHSDPVYV